MINSLNIQELNRVPSDLKIDALTTELMSLIGRNTGFVISNYSRVEGCGFRMQRKFGGIYIPLLRKCAVHSILWWESTWILGNLAAKLFPNSPRTVSLHSHSVHPYVYHLLPASGLLILYLVLYMGKNGQAHRSRAYMMYVTQGWLYVCVKTVYTSRNNMRKNIVDIRNALQFSIRQPRKKIK